MSQNTSGSLGQALRAGLISAATAFAMFQVGELTGGFSGILTEARGHGALEFGSDAHLFNIAGHAAVGCGSSVASGGKCGPGALSGAVGSFATPLTEGMSFGSRVIAMSTVGGLASVAGGGKFGNGAATAAFGYLFNGAVGRALGHSLGSYIGLALAPEGGPLSYLFGSAVGGEFGSALEDALMGYEKPTQGVLIANEGNVVFFESGNPDPNYANYPASSHVEGKAAIWMRENGSTGGVLAYNHPNGTCPMCVSNIPTLLPKGAVMYVVPIGDVTPKPGWKQSGMYVGNGNTPKPPK